MTSIGGALLGASPEANAAPLAKLSAPDRIALDRFAALAPRRVAPALLGRKTFGTAQGLVDPSVISLAVLHDGRVLSGTQNGLAFRFGDGFLAVPSPYRSKQIEALCELPNGHIVVGTAGAGVYLVDPFGKALTALSALSESTVDTVACEKKEQTFWVGNAEGLHRIFVRPDFKIEIERVGTARTTAITMADSYLVAAVGRELVRVELGDRRTKKIATLAAGDSAEALLELGGTLFVGSEAGLNRLTTDQGLVPVLGAEKFKQIYAMTLGPAESYFAGSFGGAILRCSLSGCVEEGDAGGTVLAMALQNGDKPLLFVGTDHGLVRLNLTGFRSYSSDSILNQRIEDLTASKAGELFVGIQGGFARLAQRDLTVFRSRDAATADADTVLALAHDGSPLIGTRLGEVFRQEGGKLISLELGLDPFQSIFSLRASPSGWLAATRAGLFIGETSLDTEHRKDRVSSLSVPELKGSIFAAEWWKDELWIATETALFVGRVAAGAGFRQLRAEDGLVNDNVNVLMPERVNDEIRAMWVGTNGGGVVRFARHGAGWKSIAFDETVLRNGVVNSLVQDRQGRVYVGTNLGVSRLTLACKTSLDCALEKDEYFSTEDGLADNETIIGSAVVMPDGRYFVGTASGLSVLSEVDDRLDHTAKTLLVRRPYVDDREVEVDALQRLDHRHQSVRLDWALASNFRDADTRYRSQLYPLEPNPREWTSTSSREFTGLNSGSYSLRVWGKDYAGNVSGPTSIAITIAPPPWATWWAYVGYSLALVGFVFVIARARIRQLQHRAEALERIVEERTRDIQQKADEIQRQKEELEASYKEADLIFAALREALKGSLLNDTYKLEDELGVGGFGVVYRATEVRSGQQFAIKVFRPQSGNDSTDSLERFKLEGKTSARIIHPNAIRVFEHGVTKDGIAYIVMELLNGKSVGDELDNIDRMEPLRVLKIAAEASDALAFAHELGVIHRDIKPDNIFMHRLADGTEQVKVLDFGVAKANQNAMTMAMRSLTMSGELIGTPYYLAPERIQNQPYDGRSDVYAMGIMAYQLLVGTVPFGAQDDNMFSAVLAHLNEPIPDLPMDLLNAVPKELALLVKRAMSKDPEERPTASEFASEARKIAAMLEGQQHAS